MTDTRPVTCQECGWEGTVGQCEPIAPRHLPDRVPAGDVMPAGECPECGASAMLDKQPKPSREPSIAIATMPDPQDATKFGVLATAHGLANVMALTGNKFTYHATANYLAGHIVVVREAADPRAIVGYLRIAAA